MKCFKVGCVGVAVRYTQAGWFATYTIGRRVVDDSEKIWHPDMPLAENASKKAEAVARAYAKLLKQTEC